MNLLGDGNGRSMTDENCVKRARVVLGQRMTDRDEQGVRLEKDIGGH